VITGVVEVALGFWAAGIWGGGETLLLAGSGIVALDARDLAMIVIRIGCSQGRG